jgi:phage terminase small subunit
MSQDFPGIDLSVRQKRFIWHYLTRPTLFDPVRAAEAAGYKNKTAGYGILRVPKVKKEINRRLAEMEMRFEWDIDRLLAVFERIAFDPRDEKEGGPSRTERMTAATKLGETRALFKDAKLNVTSSLEQLLLLADQRAAALPKPEPPARLKLVHDTGTGG